MKHLRTPNMTSERSERIAAQSRRFDSVELVRLRQEYGKALAEACGGPGASGSLVVTNPAALMRARAVRKKLDAAGWDFELEHVRGTRVLHQDPPDGDAA